MANNEKEEVKQVAEKQVLENDNFLAKAEAFIVKNKKTIIYCVSAVVLVVVLFFAIKKWYIEPRNERAAADMFKAENYFDNNEYEKALNGDEATSSLGFIDIIDEYGSTPSGKLARYYAGLCELRLGKFQDAVDHLSSYKGKDTYTKGLAIMAQGDAEMELGHIDDAIKLYEKASKASENMIVSPTALFKLGVAYIMQKDYDSAIEAFETVKSKYPQSAEYGDMDKYIALAEASK